MPPRSCLLPLALGLAACGAQPAPEMFGAARSETVVNGRRYVVFHSDRRVEVIRLGRAAPGEHQAIRAEMIGLIGPVTGCRLVDSTLQGDSGEMRGTIRC
jgi:hypothetical protein